MRFIVEIFRTAILVTLFVAIAGFVFFLLSVGSVVELSGASVLVIVLLGALVIGLLCVVLGLAATVISIFDLQVELVEELRLLRKDLPPTGGE